MRDGQCLSAGVAAHGRRSRAGCGARTRPRASSRPSPPGYSDSRTFLTPPPTAWRTVLPDPPHPPSISPPPRRADRILLRARRALIPPSWRFYCLPRGPQRGPPAAQRKPSASSSSMPPRCPRAGRRCSRASRSQRAPARSVRPQAALEYAVGVEAAVFSALRRCSGATSSASPPSASWSSAPATRPWTSGSCLSSRTPSAASRSLQARSRPARSFVDCLAQGGLAARRRRGERRHGMPDPRVVGVRDTAAVVRIAAREVEQLRTNSRAGPIGAISQARPVVGLSAVSEACGSVPRTPVRSRPSSRPGRRR